MIVTKNIEEAKKLILKTQKPIIVLAQDQIFNRKILEFGRFDVLMSPERLEQQSGLKQSNSGLNEILARIAKKNNIAIGIDLEEIKLLNRKEKTSRLIKIKQNIKICRSIGTQLYIKGDMSSSILASLGASTKQSKEATQSF